MKNSFCSYTVWGMKSSPYVEVRLSRLSGDGAFARCYIGAGTVVHSLTGRAINRAALDQVDMDEYGVLQIDDDLFLLAEGGADDYINHSCDPNLAFTKDGKAFYALRDIRAGEELTFDYATAEEDAAWKVECLCGVKTCRGDITGFFALSLADQEKLYPFCLPYLKRKYTNRVKRVA